MVSMRKKQKRTKQDRGRWSSQRKSEVVLRVLKGEDLDTLSRELKISTSKIAEWRDQFLDAGQAGLKSREPDPRDEENNRLKSKVGELTMEIELLNQKMDLVEDGLRPPRRRSKQ